MIITQIFLNKHAQCLLGTVKAILSLDPSVEIPLQNLPMMVSIIANNISKCTLPAHGAIQHLAGSVVKCEQDMVPNA